MTKRVVAFIGWFVAWDDSMPLQSIWSDWDTRHCTHWLWRCRLNRWFVCPFKGHDWYADMCGRRDHDICYRCEIRRDQTLLDSLPEVPR